MVDQKKINILLLSQATNYEGESRTNIHVKKLANNFDENINPVIHIADIDFPIPEVFEQFIDDLDSGKDFSELKKDISYEMKVILNDLRKKIQDIDIVHVHHTGVFFLALMAKLFFDKKVLITLHSLILKKSRIKKYIGEKAYNQCILMEKLLINSADGIITTFKQQREEVFKFYPSLARRKVNVVHSGIDTKKYFPSYSLDVLAKFKINSSLPYVFFIGKVIDCDDVNYIVDVIDNLSLSSQAVLYLKLPRHNDEIVTEFIQKIDNLRKSRIGIIEIPKTITEDEKKIIFSHASAVGYPLMHEPPAFPVLETLACGTPVVSTALGEVKEIIKHGEGGFLVEPGLSPIPPYEQTDKKGFVKRISVAINRIVEDRALNKRLSIRSRETIEEGFSWEVISAKTVLIYNKIMLI